MFIRSAIEPTIHLMNQALAYDRQPIGHCAQCRRPSAPYAYLQDGRHYCAPCARTAATRGRLRVIGRRSDDLSYDDLVDYQLPR